MMRTIARPTVVLPDPDSPTSPSVSPRLIVRLTPSTAWTQPVVRRKIPLVTGNQTRRPSTSRCACSALTAIAGSHVRPPGVDRVAETIADKVDGEDEDDDQDGRGRPLPQLSAQDADRAGI